MLYGAGIQTKPPFITHTPKHTWIIHTKRCPRISFLHYRVWNTSFQTVQGSNEAWKMGQSHWKPWHWTEWKRKHKGPIGWILWMGAPYTCKWYTLSGHPGTSSHSCHCWTVAEWISQRKEGLRIANGEGGRAGSFTEGGCWVKGDLAPGKDWVKKQTASWVYVSLHSLPSC